MSVLKKGEAGLESFVFHPQLLVMPGHLLHPVLHVHGPGGIRFGLGRRLLRAEQLGHVLQTLELGADRVVDRARIIGGFPGVRVDDVIALTRGDRPSRAVDDGLEALDAALEPGQNVSPVVLIRDIGVFGEDLADPGHRQAILLRYGSLGHAPSCFSADLGIPQLDLGGPGTGHQTGAPIFRSSPRNSASCSGGRSFILSRKPSTCANFSSRSCRALSAEGS